MNTAVVHVHRGGPLVALVGNPNCGKTALFNRLTGSRQKVANYAGVTVERKEGRHTTAHGKSLRVLDLPGTYSLHPRSPDERVTTEVLQGQARGEKRPDLVVCVVDATNLRRTLRLVLGVKRLGLRCVVALNMTDQATQRGLRIDADALARALGVPVVPTVAVAPQGDAALRELLAHPETWTAPPAGAPAPTPDPAQHPEGDHAAVREILQQLNLDTLLPHTATDRIDAVVLHPVAGPLLLALVLFAMFQAVFLGSEAPTAWIEAGTAWVGEQVTAWLPEGAWRSLLVDGVIAGAGGVLAFLPQILVLFFFILSLEESGYLPRAAFLLDRMMGRVGLSGRSFIPLLSSFACAIPGIMATRSITDLRDRRVTMLLAPLMTCSARLPVYALLIGAFVPERTLAGGIGLRGLVLFGLYVAGIVGAGVIAWLLKRFTRAGRQVRPLMMELPTYHWPSPRNLALGLWQRATIFIKRVGGIILVLSIALWFLASFPAPPDGATGAAIHHSLAGRLGHAMAPLFEPIGFNWQICIALVPGLAAREVAVSALGTVYALSATGDDTAQALAPLIASQWSLATALSLLAWYVFAPQCIATLAALKRETGGWRLPVAATAGLFVLAWCASFAVYRLALFLGWG
ncbi:ferrous iron transporter B [Ideonella sp. DXS29W]|uniref:Ferrous iron transport protein B n=1 Tax=Ideonella lacteola TaxID=2984193 RepID=A0ABU9BKP7_9BURK